jgi:hypothetical protein
MSVFVGCYGMGQPSSAFLMFHRKVQKTPNGTSFMTQWPLAFQMKIIYSGISKNEGVTITELR